MGRLSMVVHSDPAVLLSEAARDFLVQPRTPAERWGSPGHLLVLRQGGLRDDLFELAQSRGVVGWLDPPLCLFHDLSSWLGATTHRPLGDFERAALLEHLLRSVGGDVFREREGVFLAAVDRLFGELTAEGVSPDEYEAVVVAGESLRESFERNRDLTLARVYRAYVTALAEAGRRDGRDTLVDVAAAVAQSPEMLEQRLGGRREIRIVGLADLKGGWRLLLKALVGSSGVDRVVLYQHTPLQLPDFLARVVETMVVADSSPVPPSAPVTVIGGRDEDAELETVAVQVRRLVEQGVVPHRIAVIARDGRPYLDLAVRALERAGVPASARRRANLLEIPVLRAVLAVLRAAARGWTRHDLVELGSQPYFASDVDSRAVNYLGYRRRITGLGGWRAALEGLLQEARNAEAALEDDDRKPRTLPSAWVERALERFEKFAKEAVTVEGMRPLADWLAWLDDWITQDPWQIKERIGRVPHDHWSVLRLDLLGWRQLQSIIGEWRAAVRQWPGDPTPLSPEHFLDRLRTMLAGDVAFYTETRRGVQVLEALAASHRSFDHVFLIGMNAGAFPRRPPSSMLLGEHDRERLRAAGLPLETTFEWEGRERALFDILTASARYTLTLSYVARDELGGAANPSSFVEMIQARHLVDHQPDAERSFCRSLVVAQHAHRVATIERLRATGRLSPWNGQILEPQLVRWLAAEFGEDRIWSPTQLEAFAKCPWSYFSERLLRLDAREDPDEDMDLRVRGSVLHDSLRRFYDQARLRVEGPVFLTSDDRIWALPLLRAAITEALEVAGATLWLGHPALRDVKHAELVRLLEGYLEFEIEENEKAFKGNTKAGKTVRTAVDAHEVRFDDVALCRDGMTVRYRGIVDRIEVGVDDRAPGPWVAAVDYKTSKWSAPAGGSPEAWHDDVVLQVPLYAHALTVLRPGSMVARVEYRAIKHAERVHQLNLVQVGKSGVREDGEAERKMEGALSAVARHVRQMRDGLFPAKSAPSCHCPPFCHAWDICRVAGGPSTGRDR